MSFLETLVQLANQSGCSDATGCERILLKAASRQTSLVDALLDEKVVDEGLFLELLSTTLGIDWQPRPELDLS